MSATKKRKASGIEPNPVSQGAALAGEAFDEWEKYVETVKVIERENKDLKRLLAEKEAAAAQPMMEIEEKDRRINELEQELKKAHQEKDRELNEQRARHIKKIEDKRAEWQQEATALAFREADKAINDQAASLVYERDRVQMLEKELDGISDELKKAAAAKDAALKELADTKQRFEAIQAELEGQVSSLQATLNSRQETITTLEDKVQELSGAVPKEVAVTDEVKAGDEGTEMEVQDAAQDTATSQLQAKEAQLSQLELELKDAKAMLEESLGRSSDLEEQLKAKDSQLQALKARSQAPASQDDDMEEEKAADGVEVRETLLKVKDEELKRLEAQVTELHTELQEKTKELETLRREREENDEKIKTLESRVKAMSRVETGIETETADAEVPNKASEADENPSKIFIRELDTNQRFLRIKNGLNVDVAFSGWQLVSEETGASFELPDWVVSSDTYLTVWWGKGNEERVVESEGNVFWEGSDEDEVVKAHDRLNLLDIAEVAVSSVDVEPGVRVRLAPNGKTEKPRKPSL